MQKARSCDLFRTPCAPTFSPVFLNFASIRMVRPHQTCRRLSAATLGRLDFQSEAAADQEQEYQAVVKEVECWAVAAAASHPADCPVWVREMGGPARQGQCHAFSTDIPFSGVSCDGEYLACKRSPGRRVPASRGSGSRVPAEFGLLSSKDRVERAFNRGWALSAGSTTLGTNPGK